MIKSCQDISNKSLAKPMKSCSLALGIDGTQDDLIYCFKESKNVRQEKFY